MYYIFMGENECVSGFTVYYRLHARVWTDMLGESVGPKYSNIKFHSASYGTVDISLCS